MTASYSIGDYAFKVEDFFPRDIFDEITNVRVDRNEVIREEARSRTRRKKLTNDGKLTILAADHPARMVTQVGDDPVAMGDRYELLGRILRVVTDREFDGIMSTPDIVEELMIVDHLCKEAGGRSFLDEKIIIGCMNRGGLDGTVFEMDDRMTAYTAESIKEMRLDAAKVMFRLEVNEKESGVTIGHCAKAINELNGLGIPVFVEALPVIKEGGKYKTLRSTDSLIKIVGVCAGLGYTSSNTWLKIPYCERFERVSRATTCPILLLGGEATGNPTDILRQFVEGMRSGANVRGALVGRNITFPGKDDPLAVANAVCRIAHDGYNLEQSIDHVMKSRGKNLNVLSQLF